MKHIVSTGLFFALLGAATQSHAVYNLYKKDGLTLDINGQIDMQATKQDQSFEITAPMYEAKWNNGRWAPALHEAGDKLATTDRKPRLGQNNGISYVDIRGSQKLPDDWRVTGNIGLNYDTERQLYLSNSSLSFDKKGLGAVSMGRQYLHAGYVNRTDTDTPLDIFSTSSIRADYTGIDGLHASAYYSFTGNNDIRRQDNHKQKNGYGASASYRYDLGQDQYLRTAAGVSFAEYNPVTSNVNFTGNTLNRFPRKTQGVAGSVEYRTGPFLVAADVGRKNETMSDSPLTPLDKKVSDYVGAKVAYQINPVMQVSAGYGTKKTKSHLKAGAAPLYNTNKAILTKDAYSFVNYNERHLFDNIDTQEMYTQVDYLWRPNVRFYGRYDSEVTKNTLAGKKVSQLKDNNYRAGIVFAF